MEVVSVVFSKRPPSRWCLMRFGCRYRLVHFMDVWWCTFSIGQIKTTISWLTCWPFYSFSSKIFHMNGPSGGAWDAPFWWRPTVGPGAKNLLAAGANSASNSAADLGSEAEKNIMPQCMMCCKVKIILCFSIWLRNHIISSILCTYIIYIYILLVWYSVM